MTKRQGFSPSVDSPTDVEVGANATGGIGNENSISSISITTTTTTRQGFSPSAESPTDVEAGANAAGGIGEESPISSNSITTTMIASVGGFVNDI